MSLDLISSDLATIANEPRVQDLRLAEALGFDRPRVIRELIERNRPEIEGYGGLPCRTANPGALGGRPGREYHLNEPQALLICMFSRTPNAAAVRKNLIEVFMQWRRERQGVARTIEDRVDRLEAIVDGRYALALARELEKPTADGMHLGPTDLRICASALRACSRPMPAPSSQRAPSRWVDQIVARRIEAAGHAGIRRSALTHEIGGAANLDAGLDPLIRSGAVRVFYEQNPRGGPLARRYVSAGL